MDDLFLFLSIKLIQGKDDPNSLKKSVKKYYIFSNLP